MSLDGDTRASGRDFIRFQFRVCVARVFRPGRTSLPTGRAMSPLRGLPSHAGKPAFAHTLPLPARVAGVPSGRHTRGHPAIADSTVTDHADRTRAGESLHPVSGFSSGTRRKTFSEDMPAPPFARAAGLRMRLARDCPYDRSVPRARIDRWAARGSVGPTISAGNASDRRKTTRRGLPRRPRARSFSPASDRRLRQKPLAARRSDSALDQFREYVSITRSRARRQTAQKKSDRVNMMQSASGR